MKKLITIAFAAFIAVTLSATAGSVWKAHDSESPILIKYTGEDTAPKVLVNKTTVVLFESANTTSNTFTLGTGTNISTVLKQINSATSYTHTATSPVYPWKAIRWAGLLADNLTNACVIATNTLVKGQWDKVFKWDTSESHFDAAVSDLIGDSVSPLGAEVTSIFGDVSGGGNATVYLYEDDTVKYQRAFLVSTNTHFLNIGADTNVAVNVVAQGNLPATGIVLPGLKIGQGKVGFVRVTLSGTNTTGGVGASVE